MSVEPTSVPRFTEVSQWRDRVLRSCADGGRLAGLYATEVGDIPELVAVLSNGPTLELARTALGEERSYPALTPEVPAAVWYERALHNLSGIEPVGHPQLDLLLLPKVDGVPAPRPGSSESASDVELTSRDYLAPVSVSGQGVFTLPFGPVRSGIVESLELLLETGGEDILRLDIRPHYKHRQIAKRFEHHTAEDAVLLAERVEGVHSVAHALAFSHALEEGLGIVVPARAQLIRVILAELERVANHLDVVTQLCECAGLSVAVARFGTHKERVMRLMSHATGSRFGRGVVVPGGVTMALRDHPQELSAELTQLHRAIARDLISLNRSASFLDRLRGTGRLAADLAQRYGALGPIGRASDMSLDARTLRPYDAYPLLDPFVVATSHLTDALGRMRVREEEMASSTALVNEAASRLATRADDDDLAAPVVVHDGDFIGVAESAAGEVLYSVRFDDGRITRCFARSASFHNMVLLRHVFDGDVFTDLPFIEASFGLCYAGVAM
ncbi:NADH-quinone oxidoreductase subunit C [Dermatophilaceae bacterium Sec6.4]